MPYHAGIAGPRRWSAARGSVVFGVIQLLGTYLAAGDQPGRRPLDALAVALLLAGPALLVLRQRYPVPVLAGVVALTVGYLLRDYAYGPFVLSLVVALVSTVLAGHRRAAWLGVAGVLAGHLIGRALLGGRPAASVGELFGAAAWLLVVVAVAEQVRGRRERAMEAAHAREEETRRRAGEERLRIARELHDVLAHNISLINVQAGVALHLLDEHPEQARTALAAIKEASKGALGELRSVLGILRQDGESAPRAPAPTLARLDDLVSQAAAAGLAVQMHVTGSARPLPAGIDAAAFRIVQEALTNVVRHAGPASAVVRIGYDDEAVTVQVDDDGGATPAGQDAAGPRTAPGHGIDGMRERATALAGQLRAGRRPDGGFQVLARLPLDRAP